MVESLKELNQICQKPRYKEVGNWMVRHILRDAALPITRLLLHTRITANQVTLVSIVIGLIGISLFAAESNGLFFLGALLLQLWYLLDHVDGQLARYYKTNSLTGRFFDYMMHHLIHGVLFFSLGFYVYQMTYELRYIVWGFIASISIMMFNLVHDAKYKTFFERFASMELIRFVSSPSLRGVPPRRDDEAISKTGLLRPFGACNDVLLSVLKKGFSILHKLAEIHVVMNILTLCAFLQLFSAFEDIDFRILLFWIYGIMTPLIAIVKMTFIIKNKKIDSEFDATVREVL